MNKRAGACLASDFKRTNLQDWVLDEAVHDGLQQSGSSERCVLAEEPFDDGLELGEPLPEPKASEGAVGSKDGEVVARKGGLALSAKPVTDELAQNGRDYRLRDRRSQRPGSRLPQVGR